jgi:hypothetical protein
MERVLRCDCGYEVLGKTDEELVVGIRRHALEAHGMEFTSEEALLVAFRVQLDDFPSSPFGADFRSD